MIQIGTDQYMTLMKKSSTKNTVSYFSAANIVKISKEDITVRNRSGQPVEFIEAPGLFLDNNIFSDFKDLKIT